MSIQDIGAIGDDTGSICQGESGSQERDRPLVL